MTKYYIIKRKVDEYRAYSADNRKHYWSTLLTDAKTYPEALDAFSELRTVSGGYVVEVIAEEKQVFMEIK